MSEQTKTKPVVTLRDGAVKAAIWKNPSEKGHFYSVTYSRTFVENGGTAEQPQYRDSDSFSGTDNLKLMVLAQLAYQKIIELKQADANQERGAA